MDSPDEALTKFPPFLAQHSHFIQSTDLAAPAGADNGPRRTGGEGSPGASLPDRACHINRAGQPDQLGLGRRLTKLIAALSRAPLRIVRWL